LEWEEKVRPATNKSNKRVGPNTVRRGPRHDSETVGGKPAASWLPLTFSVRTRRELDAVVVVC
jgi:hypothetical protein